MKVMEQSDSIGEDNWSGHQRTIGLIDLGSHNGSDVAAWLGLTHPQRYANANAGPPPAPPDCAATGVKCEKPGASCTSGAECAGSGSLCDAGAICTGNDSICTGPATTCGPGAGDVCTGGATCVGPAAECAGPGTSCTQTTSRCGAGAYCPPSRKTRGRRAPRCVAGTYRSPPMSIVSPHEGNNGNYFFDTPIPNSDYYAHRHGFRSGGCQRLGPSAGDSAPTFKVRIEVYRSDGRLVAARYEFGDGTSRNGRACVVLRPTPSGEPAPVQECRIESPVMGYPFPSQGFVYVDQFTWKDPGIYLTHTVNVAVANAVGDRPDGGAPDSIYIVVQWQPG
jgi:hypothetical protein